MRDKRFGNMGKMLTERKLITLRVSKTIRRKIDYRIPCKKINRKSSKI